MSTDAPDAVTTEAAKPKTAAPSTPTAPAAPEWQLDTANGSLRPRSALDVLVDLPR